MRIKTSWVRMWVITLTLVFTLGLFGATSGYSPALAQETTVHKKNIVQRHPKIASLAAGIAAYKVAKTTGKNRAAAGKKKNFFQRHPILTGIGAAVATHHVIKKSNAHK